MSYKILTKNGIDNSNIDGARGEYFNSGMRDGIVQGVLNEGTFITSSNNVISFDTCELRISGHRIVMDSAFTQTFSSAPTTDTNYSLIAQIIVDDNQNVDFSIFVQTSNTALIQNDLYKTITGNGTYQVEIGKFTLKTTLNIENLVRTIDVITGSSNNFINSNETNFITDEYNKTVNLLPLRPDGIYNNSGTIMTISGDTISMFATNSVDSTSSFYLSGVNNEVKLKSGHTYTLKAFDVTGNTGSRLITVSVRKSDGTIASDYIYFYFPNTSTTFTLTEDVTLRGVSFYTVAGKAFDCSFKMGLFEDDNPTVFYPYNGELVNEKEITNDVLYDKDSEHWEINRGLTAGMKGMDNALQFSGYYGLDITKYKSLNVYVSLNNGEFKYVLKAINQSATRYNGGAILPLHSYDDICKVAMNVSSEAFSWHVGFYSGQINETTYTDCDNNANWVVTKIEGVK